MAKRHYFEFKESVSVFELVEKIGGEIHENHEKIAKSKFIKAIKNIEDAGIEDLAFISNRKYKKYISTSDCLACIVSKKEEFENVNPEIILIKTEDPYYAYSLARKYLYSEKYSKAKNDISEKAKIGSNVAIGKNVVIEDDVEIGDNVIIEHNTVIKYGVRIGNDCKIGSGAYLACCEIGDRVIIHPGVRVGTDGFGFATYKGVHHKIIHVGSVIVGNDVEIGANSTIDRGSTKDTVIGSGTIIDNLVQIGHNVEIGRGCIIVAQVGIAGSSKLGDYVAVGGQAGISGHLNIANFVQIAGKSGVIEDIEAGQTVGGYPSQPIRNWHKQTILLRKMVNGKQDN